MIDIRDKLVIPKGLLEQFFGKYLDKVFMDEERDYIIKVLKNYGYKNIDDLIDRKIDKDVLYTILDRFFSYYRIQEQEDKKASTDKK